MADKYLPIQFFEKRKEYDDRATEGGGNDKIPPWVLTGQNLQERSILLTDEMGELSKEFERRRKKASKLPMVVCTTIEDKAIAKSHRENITSMFATDEGSNVIGFWGDRCLLTTVSEENKVSEIEYMLSDTDSQAKLISSIKDIAPFYGFSDEYDPNVPYYQVRLVNYNNADTNSIAGSLFEQLCAESGIRIAHKTKYTPDMTIYRVRLDSMDEMGILEDFEGIYSIEKSYPIAASLDSLFNENPVIPKVPEGEADNYPIVGVLDSGISHNDYLDGWIESEEFTSYPDEYKDPSHGTFVAGIIEYGDELNGYSYTSLPGVRLFDATVFPDTRKEYLYADDLVDNVREAVERNQNIKIWNLSIGTDDEADLSEFSYLGMALDNIQDEYNVLIVKSAGNCRNFTLGLPKSRISKSADSVRSLVVGSLAHKKSAYDYAEVNMPSPFTRIGPGPGSIVKPDLVFYGGNAGMKDGRMVITGVHSFSPDGTIVQNVGTSFSTPWISRLAAELAYLIDEEFDPLLIRALMIHSAKYPASCRMDMAEKVKEMGFGMPPAVNEMLFNSSDEITLILRDTLEKGTYLEMFDFPYPTSLIDENGFFTGQIILTLVTKSLLDDKQAGEYCQSNIDILLGTYDTEVDRDVNQRNVINPKGLGEPQNVLLDSLYSKRVKGGHLQTGFEREYTLVKYGKFHPVKKYAFDLTDMTPANKKKYLTRDRKWYLSVKGLFRDFIENDAAQRNYRLSQEFCLLLTIRDPKGEAPVYDEVSQQLENRNFIHHSIKLRNTIQIQEDGI